MLTTKVSNGPLSYDLTSYNLSIPLSDATEKTRPCNENRPRQTVGCHLVHGEDAWLVGYPHLLMHQIRYRMYYILFINVMDMMAALYKTACKELSIASVGMHGMGSMLQDCTSAPTSAYSIEVCTTPKQTRSSSLLHDCTIQQTVLPTTSHACKHEDTRMMHSVIQHPANRCCLHGCLQGTAAVLTCWSKLALGLPGTCRRPWHICVRRSQRRTDLSCVNQAGDSTLAVHTKRLYQAYAPH